MLKSDDIVNAKDAKQSNKDSNCKEDRAKQML